jgi:hypothetical protein
MKDKNKKKITKKTIDIESEFIGTPVAPVNKKEKKSDLTDEIKKFLSEPINLDSIKKILLRLRGPISDYELQRSKIFIYGIPRLSNFRKDVNEFLIRIDTPKWSYKYFLSWHYFCHLGYFSNEKIDKSELRDELARALRNWLDKNLDQITILPN